MNSPEISKFQGNLLRIKSDLSKYTDLKRGELLTYCIKDKLISTLQRYDEEVSERVNVLSKAGNIRVLKAIAKIQRNNDRQAIEDQIKKDKEAAENE